MKLCTDLSSACNHHSRHKNLIHTTYRKQNTKCCNGDYLYGKLQVCLNGHLQKNNIHAKSYIMANKQDTRIAIHHAHNYNSTSKLSASMQPLWNIVQYATLFTRLTIHFIRFYTCFSSQGGCSDSSHKRTQNTSQSQQSQIVLLAPHQDRTKQGRRCKHAIWSLAYLWLPYHGCSW